MRGAQHLKLMLLAACLAGIGLARPALPHTLSSSELSRAFINIIYPNAFHVFGAIIEAREEGRLPPIDRARVTLRGDARTRLYKAEVDRSINTMQSLGVAIDKQVAKESQADIAVLLLEPMMWTRYSGRYVNVRQGMQLDGPLDGDIVLITDLPVIESMRSGEMSIAEAIDMGVMRIYSSDQKKAALLADYGTIGGKPLPKVWSGDFRGMRRISAVRTANTSP